MDDLIRRQDAIEAIRKRVETLSRDEQFVKKCGHIDLYGTIPLIRSVPSAQAWIPLKSGRLPKQGEIVLVTVEGWFEGEMFEVGIDLAWLVKEGGYIDGFDTVNDWIEYGEWRVTAWMPIEPYREDGAHEVNRR